MFQSAEAIDSNGNLWFVLLNPLALACWNTKTAYNTENIKVVYRNDTTLQFSSGMKIVRASNGDEKIYFVTNRLQVRRLSTFLISSENNNFQ